MPDTPYLTDATLLARLQAGEEVPSSWRLLVNRHRLRVLSRAMEIVEDWELARDLAQETFLRLFESIADKREIQHLPTYLYRVCSNLAISQLREDERKNRLQAELEDFLQKSIAGIVKNEAISRLSYEDYGKDQQLQRAMLVLSKVQQRSLRLFYYHKLSYQEIAAELSVSVGEVRSALQNGKAKLRRLLHASLNKDAEK